MLDYLAAIMTEIPLLTAGLYLVATPIGSARDITLRALDILGAADVLVAEDTRTLRKLMEIHGILRDGRQVIAYHDHSDGAAARGIAGLIAEGKSVAYCSEAGSPLIADPGYGLVAELRARDLPVHVAPGPAAVIAALSLAGLPTDRFLFAGFLPVKPAARMAALRELADAPATLVFYESPRRVARTLADMAEVLGADRDGAICRELTKRFEQVATGPLEALADRVGDDVPEKGEFVLLAGPPKAQRVSAAQLDAALAGALAEGSVRDAASAVAEQFGLPRKEVYKRALALKDC